MHTYLLKLALLPVMCLLLLVESRGAGKIKPDPAVRTGVLSNGMTYFIRQNQFPEKRASFYIIRNVGALVEEDDQNGLAHFLEHMAFNGTRHFPGKGIIQMLENHGVAFGHNVNAYTSYNETVYNLTDVPSASTELIDSCLLVLRDWADGLLLTDEEIDAERGVILEEARQGRNADFRLRQQTMPVMTRGSQYAVRNIIGSTEVVKNCPYERIRSLYHDWYRTDLQAVAIVGDFDPDRMEARVKEVMGAIPAVENPKPRQFYEIPEHEDIRYVLATDPETPRTNISVNTLHRACLPEQKDEQYVRAQIIMNLYNTMLRGRISELGRKENCPFLSAGSGIYPFMRGYELYAVSATPKPGREQEAFETVYRETERVRQQGFTRGELERVRMNLLVRLENARQSQERISNDDYARSIQEYFLEGEPMMANEEYCNLASSLLKKVTLKDINELAPRWLTRHNMTITVTAPANSTGHLSQTDVLAMMDRIEAEKLQPWSENTSASQLMTEKLTGSPLKAEKKIPEIKAVEWTFANGATVVFRKSYYERGQVILTARSKGGYSLYGSEDIPSAMYLPEWIMASGLGGLDASAMARYMTGKQAGCDIALNENTEKISGGAMIKDLETLLQMVYLRFEKPRFDSQAFRIGMERVTLSMNGMENHPEKIMRDSVTRIMKNYHPRAVLMNPSTLQQITPQRMEQIYRERFSNASDFTFFIVGDIEEKQLLPLVEKYIGSISGTGKTETCKDNGMRGPQGKLQREIRLPMDNDKATVILKFEREIKNTPQREICLSLLTSVLENRLNEQLREQEGGTYGVHVNAGGTREPYESFNIMVTFDCASENAVRMRDAVFAAIQKLCQEPPAADELKKLTRNLLLEEEQSRVHNDYWMEVIQVWYTDGINIDAPENYRNIVKNIQPEDIRTFAAELLENPNVVDLIFKP